MSDIDSDLESITITGGGSGIELRAKPPSKFNCGEFTLRDDMPIAFLFAPWIQFEPMVMQEWRMKMSTEVVRRTLAHTELVKKVRDMQMLRQDDQKHMDKYRDQTRMAFKMWAEERKKAGLPEDFSDIKE